MIVGYIKVAMKAARYKILEDGSFYGEIDGLEGVWSNADTLEGARDELEEWIALRLSRNLPIPPVGDVTISAPSVA